MPYFQAIENQIRLIDFWGSREGFATAFAAHAQMLGTEGSAPAPQDLCRALVHELESGDSYYISTDIGDALHSALATFPNCRIPESYLPTRAGFVWFETPPFEDLRAFSWESMYVLPVGKPKVPALNVTFYEPGSMDDDRWQNLPRLHSSLTWPFLDGWDDFKQLGQTPDAQERLAEMRMARAMVASFFTFLQQPFVTSATQSTGQEIGRKLMGRTARRRVSRWPSEPLVRVIQLRRAAAAQKASSEDNAEIDWSCRWLVGGHWRNQPYPTLGIIRPIFILPYVKGPDDKPLKPPRAKLFAVVR
jgi:hypothetical protein